MVTRDEKRRKRERLANGRKATLKQLRDVIEARESEAYRRYIELSDLKGRVGTLAEGRPPVVVPADFTDEDLAPALDRVLFECAEGDNPCEHRPTCRSDGAEFNCLTDQGCVCALLERLMGREPADGFNALRRAGHDGPDEARRDAELDADYTSADVSGWFAT